MQETLFHIKEWWWKCGMKLFIQKLVHQICKEDLLSGLPRLVLHVGQAIHKSFMHLSPILQQLKFWTILQWFTLLRWTNEWWLRLNWSSSDLFLSRVRLFDRNSSHLLSSNFNHLFSYLLLLFDLFVFVVFKIYGSFILNDNDFLNGVWIFHGGISLLNSSICDLIPLSLSFLLIYCFLKKD